MIIWILGGLIVAVLLYELVYFLIVRIELLTGCYPVISEKSIRFRKLKTEFNRLCWEKRALQRVLLSQTWLFAPTPSEEEICRTNLRIVEYNKLLQEMRVQCANTFGEERASEFENRDYNPDYDETPYRGWP